ncbi:EAL domain-containing protein [Vibrio rumoiensis]|uniref:bifunctional diguanylate cyclase/phosphodiesterase n=1 Tax=Vibrio rumoiensis TaxID=76258 RepID=UPI003AA8DE63
MIILLLSGFFDGIMKHVLGDMSKQLVTSKSDLASQQIEAYINKPFQAATLLSRSLSSKDILSPEFIKGELSQILKNDFTGENDISRIGYASIKGDYIALSRISDNNRLRLIETAPNNQYQLVTYQGESNASPVLKTVENYHLLKRDWFIQASQQMTPFWSLPYLHISEDKGMVMTYRTPVFNRQGQFIGVINVDINPDTLSHYLDSIDENHNLHIIVAGQQQIVAASDTRYLSNITMPPLSLDNNKVTLPQLSDSKTLNEIIPSHIWTPQKGNIPYTVYQGNTKYWVQARALTDHDHLLNWNLLTITPAALPSHLFTQSSKTMMLTIIFIVSFGLTGCAWMLIRFLTPLKAIAEQARLLGQTKHIKWLPQSDKRLFPEIAELEQELINASDIINHALQTQKKLIEEDASTKLPTFAGLLAQKDLYTERQLSGLIRLANYPTMANTLGKAYAEQFLIDFIDILRDALPVGTSLSRVRVDILAATFPGVYGHQTIQILAKNLQDLFFNVSREHDHVFTGNIGLIHQELNSENLQNTLLNASLALHQAQQKGNGFLEIFEPWMHNESMDNLRLHDQLRDGIRNQEFHLVLQPIVNLDDSQNCVEAECLIRWQTEERGFIPPDKFIAIAEKTGLIVPLGRWIIEKACQELATFIERGAPRNFKLHINIASLQFCQPNFTEHLLDCVQRYHLTHNNICLEITESTMLTDMENVAKVLHSLQRSGISIAIDDFGSGYSSLSYLHNLPFDTLKIDRSFVSDMLSNKKNEAVIASVLNLARNFNVPLIAEGIETKEMSAKLYQMGCEKVQGYYFGRPLKFSEWHPSNGAFKLELEA